MIGRFLLLILWRHYKSAFWYKFPASEKDERKFFYNTYNISNNFEMDPLLARLLVLLSVKVVGTQPCMIQFSKCLLIFEWEQVDLTVYYHIYLQPIFKVYCVEQNMLKRLKDYNQWRHNVISKLRLIYVYVRFILH